MVKVYQRTSQTLVEQGEYQGVWLKRLYTTPLGHFLRPILTAPLASEILRFRQFTPWSRRKIQPFVTNYGVDLTDFEEASYPHFAAFFERRVKAERRPVCSEREILAVADAKLQVFPISQDLQVKVKHQNYHLADLLGKQDLAKSFDGGMLCLYRLAIEDCHHYLAAETGTVSSPQQIKGKLHSVRDIVQEKVPVFNENKRVYTEIDSHLGPVLQMEVGALLVGAIHNQPVKRLVRGQDKGYFSFGGSSIIVLYPKGTIAIDNDILHYSSQGIETQVLMGERIGRKLC